MGMMPLITGMTYEHTKDRNVYFMWLCTSLIRCMAEVQFCFCLAARIVANGFDRSGEDSSPFGSSIHLLNIEMLTIRMKKTLICFFEGKVTGPSGSAVQLQLSNTSATVGKPPHNPFIVQDLQPVKTYFVFSVHTMSSTATFPQLNTKTQPSAVRAAVEKQNPNASLT